MYNLVQRFFFDTGEVSSTSFAEAEYFHPLLEVEASEGSQSRDSIESYETGEYLSLLCKKETVVFDAVAAACSSQHQAYTYTEEWSDGCAAGLGDSQRFCENCLGATQKRHVVS